MKFKRQIGYNTSNALQRKKQQGVRLGRPSTYSDEVNDTVIRMKQEGYSGKDITAATGMSAGQISKIYKKYKERAEK